MSKIYIGIDPDVTASGVCVWRDIAGYNGLYRVSDNGLVMSLPRKDRRGRKVNGGIKPPQKASNGYSIVCLSKNGKNKMHLIHRLVAEAFIPNPEQKMTVNHINGIKTDNRLSNLEWATQGENNAHSYHSGLKPPVRTRQKRIAVYVDGVRKEFCSIRDMCRETGIQRATIQYAIRNNRTTCPKIHVKFEVL